MNDMRGKLVEGFNSRIDKISKLADGVTQIHPSYHSSKKQRQDARAGHGLVPNKITFYGDLSLPCAIRETDLYASRRFRLIDAKTRGHGLRITRPRRWCSRGHRRWERTGHSACHGRRRRLRNDTTESAARTREAPPRSGNVILLCAS